MKNNFKKFIPLIVIGIFVCLILFLVFIRYKYASLEINIKYPGYVNIIDDPILGHMLVLQKGKYFELDKKYKFINKNNTEIVIEDDSIINYNKETDKFYGTKVGTTKIYIKSKNGKIISNKLEITVTN